jgi:hypothetical protein
MEDTKECMQLNKEGNHKCRLSTPFPKMFAPGQFSVAF